MSKRTPDYDFEQKTYGTSIWGEAFKRLLRNKAAIIGGIIFLCVVLVAVFADVIAPYGYEEQSLQEQYLPPFSPNHIFGTDNLGRDIFSRVVYDARLSLSVGIVSVALAMFVGIIIGIFSGYCGGIVDNILMRLMDILLAIPAILLAICISASLGTGLLNLMIAVGISTVPTYARIARASVMMTKGEDFIEAARATGRASAAGDKIHRTQHRRAAGCSGYAWRRRGNHIHRRSGLSGSWHPATPVRMGHHAGKHPQLHALLPLSLCVPGSCNRHHHFVPESVGRRSARRVRPQAEAVR